MIENTTPLLPVLAALARLKDDVRAKHSEIPDVTIVVGASGKLKNGMKNGHFHAGQWDDAHGAPAHEVDLSGEGLGRGAEATLGTLIHELAHATAHAQDIKDTSNNGRYHNTKFKAIAEGFGITLEQGGTIGWSVTTLPEETAAKYKDGLDQLRDALTTYRTGKGDGKPSKPSKKQPLLKCPYCEDGIRTSKKFAAAHTLLCEEHDEELQLIEED